jgi:hypothetical protein
MNNPTLGIATALQTRSDPIASLLDITSYGCCKRKCSVTLVCVCIAHTTTPFSHCGVAGAGVLAHAGFLVPIIPMFPLVEEEVNPGNIAEKSFGAVYADTTGGHPQHPVDL